MKEHDALSQWIRVCVTALLGCLAMHIPTADVGSGGVGSLVVSAM